MSRLMKRFAGFCFATVVVLVVVSVLQPSMVSHAQVAAGEEVVDEVSIFPDCQSLLEEPGDIASYETGWHEILGIGLREGNDDVYAQPGENTTQCYCPPVGTGGIQTNWWKTHRIEVEGWTDIANGQDWGLDEGHYLAMNLNFDCDDGSSAEGARATIQVMNVIDADGDLHTADDQTPGVGWKFDITGSTQTEITDSVGETPIVVVDIGTHIVSEVLDSGYKILNATCLGADVNGSFGGNSVSGVEVTSVSQSVICVFYNSPIDQGGSQAGSSGSGGDGDPAAPTPRQRGSIPAIVQNATGSVLGATTDGTAEDKGGAVAGLPQTGISIAWLVLLGLFLIGAIFLPLRKLRR